MYDTTLLQQSELYPESRPFSSVLLSGIFGFHDVSIVKNGKYFSC
jgi:hypothetical protein